MCSLFFFCTTLAVCSDQLLLFDFRRVACSSFEFIHRSYQHQIQSETSHTHLDKE